MDSYIITCSDCGSDNRIPAEMEGKKGRCGRCRSYLPPLFYRPQVVTDTSFDGYIARYPGPVLAEFWAPG